MITITSLRILPETHDLSLCDTPHNLCSWLNKWVCKLEYEEKEMSNKAFYIHIPEAPPTKNSDKQYQKDIVKGQLRSLWIMMMNM